MTENSDQLKKYYKAVGSLSHAKRTEAAAKLQTSSVKVAVDCGCGTGNDISFLVDAGYKVFGFDSSAEAVSICNNRFIRNRNVEIFHNTFESYDYPRSTLLIAHSSLFFADPEKFDETWENISNSIKTGGIFSGDFMGKNDDWANGFNLPITLVSKDQLELLFGEYEILFLKERDEIGSTAVGKSKHWHTYSVVARKRT